MVNFVPINWLYCVYMTFVVHVHDPFFKLTNKWCMEIFKVKFWFPDNNNNLLVGI